MSAQTIPADLRPTCEITETESVPMNRVAAMLARGSRRRRPTEYQRRQLYCLGADVLSLMLNPRVRLERDALERLFEAWDEIIRPALEDAAQTEEALAISKSSSNWFCLFCGCPLRDCEARPVSVTDADGEQQSGLSCVICEAARHERTPAQWARMILTGPEQYV